MRSISAGGGSSATKRWASSCEMNRAVEGCAARMSSTFSPSSLPPPAGNGDAENGLFPFVVSPVVVGERPALIRLVDGPAGEAARHFDDILLRVAAVHAEGVQLHQLARVVLIQAARGLLGALCSAFGADRLRRYALPVVQIKHHGGAIGGGFEQIAELPQHVRADGVALIGGHQNAIRALTHDRR